MQLGETKTPWAALSSWFHEPAVGERGKLGSIVGKSSADAPNDTEQRSDPSRNRFFLVG
jgi:hypothetical protein